MAANLPSCSHVTYLFGLVPKIFFQGVCGQLGQAELEVGPQILIHIYTRAGSKGQSWCPGLVLILEEGGSSGRQLRERALSQNSGSFEHLQAGLLPPRAKVPHHQLQREACSPRAQSLKTLPLTLFLGAVFLLVHIHSSHPKQMLFDKACKLCDLGTSLSSQRPAVPKLPCLFPHQQNIDFMTPGVKIK